LSEGSVGTKANNEYIAVVNINAMERLREATLAVTYKCNFRCSMCNIWKVSDFEELAPEEYRKLPNSLRSINITGGEPFLRSDLVEVVRSIHEIVPGCRIVISSNGSMTDRIVSAMAEMKHFHPKLGIGISVDGLYEVHDRVRGVEGAFEKASETVRAVKAAGIEDVRIGMTIVKENSSQVLAVYRLSKELGVEFTTTVAHNSDIYFRKDDNCPVEALPDVDRDLRRIGDAHLRSLSPKAWFRAYHIAGIANSSIRSSAVGLCTAGTRFIFMDPRGDVYPCIVLNKVMGNIREFDSVEALLSAKKAQIALAAVKACRKDCWMVCNTRSLILSHPGRPIRWMLNNKPRAHLSRSR
jgi:MoaA/NifB/PqqE/SkfB family radical SAM enzyme